MGSPSRTRRWTHRIVVALGSTLAALIVCEVILRVVWVPPVIRTDLAFDWNDPVYGSAPIPGAKGNFVTWEFDFPFNITPQGLRGNKIFAAQRPDGVSRRVLFLGDSFTWGLGAANAEIFVELIASGWPDVEVANTGCNGYGQRQELAALHHFGAVFKPDLTVLTFFWNDLRDNLAPGLPSWDLVDGRVVRTDPVPDRDPLAQREPTDVPGASRWRPYLFRLVRMGTQPFRHGFFGVKRDPFTPEMKEQSWDTVRELLGLIAKRAEELETRLVIAAMPDCAQIYPDFEMKGMEPYEYEVQHDLEAICGELGVKYIDLLPGLRKNFEETGETLYYYNNRHLTPAGNRVVVELLRPELEALLEL